jgi:hypothetical protein
MLSTLTCHICLISIRSMYHSTALEFSSESTTVERWVQPGACLFLGSQETELCGANMKLLKRDDIDNENI